MIEYLIIFIVLGFVVGMLINDGSDDSLTRAGGVNLMIAIVWGIAHAGFGYGILTLYRNFVST